MIVATRCGAQNMPDRTVIYDPLAAPAADSGFSMFNGTRLFAEFGRYSNGSGPHHRWNAKTGGWFEIARWDSSWSIAMIGTMEMVADAFSDIGFNPRAIFWEEGLLATARLGQGTALQFGYVHRCKHDIDNLEPYLLAGSIEQYTLIYSGITARLLFRPRVVVDGPLQISAGAALRNDIFLHRFSQTEPGGIQRPGSDISSLATAFNITARIDARPRDARFGMHCNGAVMLSMFGGQQTPAPPWNGITVRGAAPFVELGADFFNPKGAAFTVFARGEWQHDGAIVPQPTPATLFIVGVRASSFQGMW